MQVQKMCSIYALFNKDLSKPDTVIAIKVSVLTYYFFAKCQASAYFTTTMHAIVTQQVT